jgi:ABC-2 type transport system ATP-binding protein
MSTTENLSRSYGNKAALVGLNLNVLPGEILGFLGPNGAGKSTTVKILTGMIRPDAGRALVAGFDVVEQPMEVKKRIGYVPETATLYDGLTGGEYLELVGCLYHLDAKTAATRRRELLELFGLLGNEHDRMSEYSKGMRQKVAIIAAMMHRPDVLIMDEPLDGLDANTAMVIKELLKQMAAQGKTILFCSHILEVVDRMCSKIVIIDKGRLVASGTSEDLKKSTGEASLEGAFGKLTGHQDVGQVAADFLSALQDDRR